MFGYLGTGLPRFNFLFSFLFYFRNVSVRSGVKLMVALLVYFVLINYLDRPIYRFSWLGSQAHVLCLNEWHDPCGLIISGSVCFRHVLHPNYPEWLLTAKSHLLTELSPS
jgi:hypothetical protein